MAEIREELVQNAVKFLLDPNVRNAPHEKQVQFLESKGLSAAEIAMAQQRAGNNIGTTLFGAPQLPPRTTVIKQRRTWTDLFIGAIGISTIALTTFHLAKTYLEPFLDFPTAKKINDDTKSISKQLESSKSALVSVSAQTSEIIKVMEKHASNVSETLAEMEHTLELLSQEDKNRERELKKIRVDVDELKAMVPKLVEKQQSDQDKMLIELQNEIKSLKGLLMNSKLTIGASGSIGEVSSMGIKLGKPSIPSWQLGSVSSTSSTSGTERAIPVSEANINKVENNPAGDVILKKVTTDDETKGFNDNGFSEIVE